jgi:tetratricopeptide (TPR) repeat protein
MDRSGDRNDAVNQRIKSSGETISAPELILGMDVMRKLHLTFAFRDGRITVAPATDIEPAVIKIPPGPPGMLAAAYKRFAADAIRQDNRKIIDNPGDAQLWNHRCWLRATAKVDLNAALSDCDHAIRLKPGVLALLDSRAFVLYQQGKYKDALDAYNLVLKIDPRFPASLFMRGFTRGKLGDEAGKTSDVAAAMEAQPDIQAQFAPYDISY